MFDTYKIQVYLIEDQQKVLWDLSEKCRLLYNLALAEQKDYWNENKALSSSISYLLPCRTRLFFPPSKLLKDPKDFSCIAQTIYECTFTKLKKKQTNKVNSHHLQRDSVKELIEHSSIRFTRREN